MKNVTWKNIRFVLFAVFAAITIYAPLSIIWKYENTLRYGTLYKFRTRPVDPYDAFRGRYVTLSFSDQSVAKTAQQAKVNEHSDRESLLYIRLKNDADGFAVPADASRTPLSGNNIVTVTEAYSRDDEWRFEYPFDRYYLPEDVAPKAEELYNRASRRSLNDGENERIATYVAVRVRNGVGVIEELYINGKPVREAVNAELKKPGKK